jgi:hypothetical protein
LLISAQADNQGAEPFLQTFGTNHPPTFSAGFPTSFVTDPSPAFPVQIQPTAQNPLATDPDAGQTLTYSLDAAAPGTVAPPGATINPTTGAFLWVPGPTDAGKTYTVTIRATDNGVPAMSTAQSFTIKVDAPPVFISVPQGTQAASVGTTLNFAVAATSPQGVVYTLDAASKALGMTIDPSTGLFSWTPAATQVGGHLVTVTATEATAPAPGLTPLSSTASVVINAQFPVATVVSTVPKLNKPKTLVTSIQLNLSAPVTTASTKGKTTFKLVALLPKNKTSPITVTVKYTAGSKTIVLTPKSALNAKTGNYRLIVSGLIDTHSKKVPTYTVFVRKGKVTFA